MHVCVPLYIYNLEYFTNFPEVKLVLCLLCGTLFIAMYSTL